MTLDLDITALLQPLPGDAPCGVSLIHDMEYDAIRAARRADDPSLPSGIWQTTLKVADWQAVEHGCRNVLATRSKDLTIAAWLGEAWLNRYGLPALPHCFELIGGLCGRYWDDLHPMPRDADFGFRAAPLAWIANAYADQLSAQVELFEGRDGLRGTLAHRLSKLGYVCREQDGPEALAVAVREGSLVVFSSVMPHRTGPNVSAGVRKSYILQYAPDGARIAQTGTACNAPDRQYLILKGRRARFSARWE